MTTALISTRDTDIEAQSPSHLISLALEKNADPETLSKLMDLQERWEKGNAKKAYVVAMTAFKQDAPTVINKNMKANFGAGKASYTYANLGSIVQEITALLGKHELSASWETSQDDKGLIVVSCHVTHVAGHRETVTLRGPADTTGSKNPIQAIGSTVTYLQRYTLLAALGLATGEDDDDTQPERPEIKAPQKKSEATKAEQAQEAEHIPPDRGPVISAAQGGRFYAIAKTAQWEDSDLHVWLKEKYGLNSTKEIPKSLYDEMCKEVEKGPVSA